MVVFLNLLHVLGGELTCLIREMIPRLISSQSFHEQGAFPFRVVVQLLVQGRPEVLLISSFGVLLFCLASCNQPLQCKRNARMATIR